MEINGQHLNSTAMRIVEKIKCLQKSKGYCWASNASLAKILGLSKSYVSHELTALVRAGVLYRMVEYDARTGEVICRKLYAFKTVQDTAINKDRIEELEKDISESGQKRRLVANGLNVGISPYKMMQAIIQFGIERVDEALAIVKASTSVQNPLQYMYAALYNQWKAGKKAQGYMGTVFTGAKRRTVRSLNNNDGIKKIEYTIEPMPELEKVVLVEGGSIKDNLKALKEKLRRNSQA